MAEHPRITKTEFFTEWGPFSALLKDKSKEVTDLQLVNEGKVMVATYCLAEEECVESAFYNPFIASLVTAYARHELNNNILGGTEKQ